MKRSIKIAIILIIIFALIVILAISSVQFTGKAIDKSEHYSYTKAICNKTNYCQDYEIACNGTKIDKIIPIAGAVVQNPETWQDPRDKETINKLC